MQSLVLALNKTIVTGLLNGDQFIQSQLLELFQ